MKITAMPSLAPSMSAQGVQQPFQDPSVRNLRMVTNATPLANAPQLPIPDVNSQTAATVEATQPLSPQLAVLAKQRRALQVKERELADREKALSSRGTGSSAIDIARLKSEPLGVLLENGVTYEQLTEAILAGQGNSEVNALKSKIEALEKGIDQRFVDKDAQTRKEALANYREEVNEILAQNENFELTRELNQAHEVIRLIDVYHQKTGKILKRETACQWIEDQLFEDNQKLANLKKMRGLFVPPTPQPQQRQQGMRTIMNKDTASVPLSRHARAMAAFYGQNR